MTEECIDGLLHQALIASGTPVSDWRPIETAPKDGTRLWLYFPHKQEDDRQCIGWWQEDGANGSYWMDHADSNITDPSHWMPRPAPPTGAS